VLYRSVRLDEDFPSGPPEIEVRPAAPHEFELWAGVVGRGFQEGKEPPVEVISMMAASFQIPGSIPLLAYVEGKLAAGAGGLIVAERKLLAIAGAATLPEFRRRGLQTALLYARLKLAAAAGCDLVVTVTQGGTTSQRNAERVGFRVAYSKATLVRKFDPDS
jgi:GNAT superfamily N-acetyltransferase